MEWWNGACNADLERAPAPFEDALCRMSDDEYDDWLAHRDEVEQ